MPKEGRTTLPLTRGDKVHKKFMDKYNVFKDGLTHSVDSLTIIHKQTLDSSVAYIEKISMSQETERSELYEIIKTNDDATRRKEAFSRLKELDRIRDEEIEKHDLLLKSERDHANKNITGSIICLAVAGGLFSNKQVRQITGKTLRKISNNLLRVKE